MSLIKKSINKELSTKEILLVSGGKKDKPKFKLPELDAIKVKDDVHVSAKFPINNFVSMGPYISGNSNTGKVNGGGLGFSIGFPLPKK